MTKGRLYHYGINADSDNPATSTIEIVGTAFSVLKTQSQVLSRVAWAVGIAVKGSQTWEMPHPFQFKMTMTQDSAREDGTQAYCPTSPSYRPGPPPDKTENKTGANWTAPVSEIAPVPQDNE